MRKILLSSFLCVMLSVALSSAGEIKFSGRFEHYRFDIATSAWRRDLSKLLGWGGTRLVLNTTIGSMAQDYYAHFPVSIMMDTPEQGIAKVVASSSDYVFFLKGKNLSYSLTSRGDWDKNFYTFSDLQDPMGALKSPNTTSPKMTFRIGGSLPYDWNMVGYYLADERTNFVPNTEIIPQPVYDELRTAKDLMPYFDETPVYKLIRLTKSLPNNITWGIIYGEKQGENINPRSNANERTTPYPSNGISYAKRNYGFDFTKFLVPEESSKFVAAIVNSTGDWTKYRIVNQVITKNHLGTLTGNAYKLSFENLKLGEAQLNIDYLRVEPEFQRTAARDSGYYYFLDSGSNYGVYGWRALEDRDFNFRDSSKTTNYLSDVSTYLGLKALEFKLDIPGTLKIGKGGRGLDGSVPPLDIARALLSGEEFYDFSQIVSSKKTISEDGSPALLTLSVNKYSRINPDDDNCLDPQTFKALRKDYNNYQAKLALDYSNTSDVALIVDYLDFNEEKSKNTYRQQIGLNINSRLGLGYSLESNLSLAKRILAESSYDTGIGVKGDISLKGVTTKGLRFASSIETVYGSYDYGLRKNDEKVYNDNYRYLAISQYLEPVSLNFNLVGVPIKVKMAGELRKEKSTFPAIDDNTAFIRYSTIEISPMKNLKLSTNSLDIFGLDGVDFHWNEFNIKDFVNVHSKRNQQKLTLTYNPFGSSNTTLQFTKSKSYDSTSQSENWTVQWQTSTNKGWFLVLYRDDWKSFQTLWWLYF